MTLTTGTGPTTRDELIERLAERQYTRRLDVHSQLFIPWHQLDGFRRRLEIDAVLRNDWPLIVAFFADWFDRVPAVVAHPWDVNEVKKFWLDQMTPDPDPSGREEGE